jgi:hypothetical protein
LSKALSITGEAPAVEAAPQAGIVDFSALVDDNRWVVFFGPTAQVPARASRPRYAELLWKNHLPRPNRSREIRGYSNRTKKHLS